MMVYILSNAGGKIRKIIIRNFKSIHDIRLDLQNGVNVLIGKNGSGKTNILEAIYFLRKALIDEYGKEPYLPHLEWWDPLNLLPERDENKTLQYVIKGDLDEEMSFEYTVSFSLSHDRLTLVPIEHYLKIGEYNTIKITPGTIYVYIDESIIKKSLVMVEEVMRKHPKDHFMKRLHDRLNDLIGKCRNKTCISSILYPWAKPYINLKDITLIGFPVTYRLRKEDKNLEITIIMLPSKELAEKERKTSEEILFIFERPSVKYSAEEIVKRRFITDQVIDLIKKIIFIKHPDIGSIRKPKRISSYDRLDTRAENLVSVMYRLSRTDKGFMERIGKIVSEFFPNTQLSFDILPDGRISLLIYEDGVSYPSPCISDGLIKLLTLLVAIELKPSLLLIDEIENSMHAKMLEKIYDELNNSGFPVLVATHSPYFIDLADLDRIFIVKKTGKAGTVLERVGEREKLRKTLEEEGLTFSEYLLTTE